MGLLVVAPIGSIRYVPIALMAKITVWARRSQRHVVLPGLHMILFRDKLFYGFQA
jgi:hypothetical protein